MRILEVQESTRQWGKLGAWQRKQDVYDHILEHDATATGPDTYRVKTYCADQLVSVRLLKALDVKSHHEGKRMTRLSLLNTGRFTHLDTRMAKSIEEQCKHFDGAFLERKSK